MCIEGIDADADQADAGLLKIGKMITEMAQFFDALYGVILWIKEKHKGRPTEICKGNLVTVTRSEYKIRRLLRSFDFGQFHRQITLHYNTHTNISK